jgi:hypothetical protein
MSDLNKQVWTGQLMKNFYPDTNFLQYAKDFTQFVDADKLKFADAGLDPKVLINNTTYPIVVTERIDTPLSIELDKFETENTLVRRPEVIEYAYDQLESVIMGHRNTLRTSTGAKAAHAFAPQEDTQFTPVLQTTGTNDGTGRLRLVIEDILRLKTKYDELDYPMDKRYLVLHPKHVEDLILLDTKAFKDIIDFKDSAPQRFAGFNFLQCTRNPSYDKTTLKKVPFNAAVTNQHTFSTFSFYGDEVMKADGELHMYATLDDPKERATIIGFDKRFVALPIRQKGIGSIISSRV